MADMHDETFWNELYEEAPVRWSGKPNPHLVDEASSLSPGDALDVGSGEGGDAKWLAERGWQVTAIDISQVALDRARAATVDLEPSITFERRDLLDWTPARDSFDLVSAQYLHLPSPQMHALVQRLARAVRRGGTLLIVGHSISDHRPFPAEFFFTGHELAALLPSGWEIGSSADRPHPHRDGLDAVLVAHRNA